MRSSVRKGCNPDAKIIGIGRVKKVRRGGSSGGKIGLHSQLLSPANVWGHYVPVR